MTHLSGLVALTVVLLLSVVLLNFPAEANLLTSYLSSTAAPASGRRTR